MKVEPLPIPNVKYSIYFNDIENPLYQRTTQFLSVNDNQTKMVEDPCEGCGALIKFGAFYDEKYLCKECYDSKGSELDFYHQSHIRFRDFVFDLPEYTFTSKCQLSYYEFFSTFARLMNFDCGFTHAEIDELVNSVGDQVDDKKEDDTYTDEEIAEAKSAVLRAKYEGAEK